MPPPAALAAAPADVGRRLAARDEVLDLVHELRPPEHVGARAAGLVLLGHDPEPSVDVLGHALGAGLAHHAQEPRARNGSQEANDVSLRHAPRPGPGPHVPDHVRPQLRGPDEVLEVAGDDPAPPVRVRRRRLRHVLSRELDRGELRERGVHLLDDLPCLRLHADPRSVAIVEDETIWLQVQEAARDVAVGFHRDAGRKPEDIIEHDVWGSLVDLFAQIVQVGLVIRAVVQEQALHASSHNVDKSSLGPLLLPVLPEGQVHLDQRSGHFGRQSSHRAEVEHFLQRGPLLLLLGLLPHGVPVQGSVLRHWGSRAVSGWLLRIVRAGVLVGLAGLLLQLKLLR
mmetsp:Transcript_64360/g.199310  ORF Transcript_64360/g.199310 Transcript_64360/m.199310 type:complete len:341 (-) Transcript_64360:803-1825(-)